MSGTLVIVLLKLQYLDSNRKDDTKASRIHIQLNDVSVSSETDWPQMAKFHADWSKKFYDAMIPYLDEVD